MIEKFIYDLAAMAPPGTIFNYGFNITALLSLILVAFICGSVGSLVIGARMAFFSDALAHSAFAGISIGLVLFTAVLTIDRTEFFAYITLVMLVFGMIMGFGIAWVREKTGLASDTVIGVFFALSIGLAAALRKFRPDRELFALEDFLFGNPLNTTIGDLTQLSILAVLVAFSLCWLYNPLLLGGFNSSLARSRRLPHRLASYAFVILLAIVVNLTVRAVGVLLINSMLILPAASAVNMGRNLRQVFWLSIILCLVSCVGGQILCWEIETRLNISLGIQGCVVLLSVCLFVLSALFGPMWKQRREPRQGSAA